MKKLRTKTFFYILFVILLANLSFLLFLFQILPEMTPQLRAIIFASGLTIFLLSIIGATAISLMLSRGITRPINEIIKATRAISKRDFNHCIKTHTYSEIEDLIFNFNYMVKQLKDFEHQTKKHNQDLENTIRARKKPKRFKKTFHDHRPRAERGRTTAAPAAKSYPAACDRTRPAGRIWTPAVDSSRSRRRSRYSLRTGPQPSPSRPCVL